MKRRWSEPTVSFTWWFILSKRQLLWEMDIRSIPFCSLHDTHATLSLTICYDIIALKFITCITIKFFISAQSRSQVNQFPVHSHQQQQWLALPSHSLYFYIPPPVHTPTKSNARNSISSERQHRSRHNWKPFTQRQHGHCCNNNTTYTSPCAKHGPGVFLPRSQWLNNIPSSTLWVGFQLRI